MSNKAQAFHHVGDLVEGKLPTSASGSSSSTDHNMWINDIDPYIFMRWADSGTEIFANGRALSEYSRERDYKVRQNFSYYLNFVQRGINALTDPLFRELPTRTITATSKAKQDLVDQLLLNANKAGMDMNNFMKQAFRNANRYGVEFIVVDNATEIAKDHKEAKEKDQRPYLYSISPEQVIEYGWDSNFNLNRIAFKDTAKMGRYDRRKGKEVKATYREIGKGWWKTFELNDEGERANVKEGALGVESFPVVPLYTCVPDHNDDPILPWPPLYHIARANLAVYDICSEIRANTRDQMFSLLVYPKTTGFNQDTIVTGTKSALGFDGEKSRHAPAYASPDPAVMKAVMEDRKFIIDMIFEMMSLVGIVGMTDKAESGRAKEIELVATRNVLQSRSLAGESAETKIFKIVGDYLKDDLDASINYSDNYDIVDETAEIERADAMLLLNISPEVNAEVKKGITKTYFRYMKSEDLNKLLETVDTESEDEIHAEKLKPKKKPEPVVT